MAKKPDVAVKKEPPSLFCQKCRLWIVTQEKHGMFAEVDGVKQHVTGWTCPGCRGDVARTEVVVAEAPKSQGDVARDERLGAYQAVDRSTVALNEGGRTARAKLACGHEACILPNAVKARCRKCVTAARKTARPN